MERRAVLADFARAQPALSRRQLPSLSLDWRPLTAVGRSNAHFSSTSIIDPNESHRVAHVWKKEEAVVLDPELPVGKTWTIGVKVRLQLRGNDNYGTVAGHYDNPTRAMTCSMPSS